MKEVVIVDAVRTPVGRYKGALKQVRPDDLAADVIRALLERHPQLPPEEIEDVVLGNANQAGEDNRNVARMAGLLAGLPEEVGGTTINRLCGSSLDAVMYASRAIMACEGDIFIAGGTESMTRAPFVMGKPEKDFPRQNMALMDTTIGWRFTNPQLEMQYGADSMPETAENVARQYHISREEQDAFALESQMRAKEAKNGDIGEEIIPVVYQDKKKQTISVTADEHPRPRTDAAKLASLRPLFPEGTVTAGNASGINDGAAALIVMSKEKADQLGIKPLVKYIGGATAGVKPDIMGIGPIYATRKLLKRTGTDVDSIGLVELNEAFASQSIACIRELGLDHRKVNVNGGAIAYGHPLGASGARILTTLIYEMKRRNESYGLATMCVGVGQGIAAMVENV